MAKIEAKGIMLPSGPEETLLGAITAQRTNKTIVETKTVIRPLET
jgi:hypothetical protein